MRFHLLLAGEDPAELSELERTAHAAGHEVRTARSTRELLERAAKEHPDACVFDALLPGALDALPRLAALEPAPAVLLVCGASEAARAVEALREGADELLVTPVRAAALDAALQRVHGLRAQAAAAERHHKEALSLAEDVMRGPSPAAARLREQVQRVAGTPDTTVLLIGERGTRKGLVARAIHAASRRPGGSFVARSCADAEVEASLAGGTGEGVALSAGGTLYLGRVCELAPDMQSRLLELLEERGFRGLERARRLEARVIASTDRELESLVEAGRFREDLFYRLNVLTVRVPALRSRAEDLPDLTESFLRRAQRRLGRPRLGLSTAALGALRTHDWSANLRELETVIEHAALLAEGDTLGPGDLRLGPGPAAETPVTARELSLRAVEEATIRRVLSEVDGNRSRAARVLGINRTTLYNKLRAYDIA